jgi:tRNA dimethylallyltransferase
VKNKHLVVIVGPTAVGKTDLSLNLAKFFNTEIISADSRQFFRETEIATAKPTLAEREEVPYHFVDSLSIQETYDVGKFENDVLTLLEELFQSRDVVVMTGGSGLYVQAVCEGVDEMPQIDPDIRIQLNKLYEEQGIETLRELLREADPEYYQTVDIQNPQRLIRALEVIKVTGLPFSSFRVKKAKERFFNTIKIGLTRPRELLYSRIDARMDQMIENGLFEEAGKLYDFRELNALQTVGYTEIFGYLEGQYDKDEAIRLLKRNSRRYAKRQMTWFRKDSEIRWFSPDDDAEILAYINSRLST